MTPFPNLLAIRALAALALAIVGLQAVPAQPIGIERHHGSAFDISSLEVATPPALRNTGDGEVRRIEPLPPPPIPAVRTPVPVVAAALPRAMPPLHMPAPTGFCCSMPTCFRMIRHS